jgi:predicted amidohydrolase YtcJ
MEYSRDITEVYEPLREGLTLRCMITLLDRPLSSEPVDCSYAREFRHDEMLAIVGYKTFIDGTLGSRTARMLQDYADDPGNRGMLLEVAAAGRLQEWIEGVADAGFSPSMHAIGDEAARVALDAILRLDSTTRRKARPRVEHAQQIDVKDIPRLRDVIASMQPLHKADDCRYVRRRLGDARMKGTFAFRSLLNAGARLAFGSDWPIVSCDPMLGIRAAVTGLTLDDVEFHPDQNLTVEQAVTAYTRDAAAALGMERAGRLIPGAFADLVLFDRDPFDADWVDAPPRVMMTIANGKVVHDACEAQVESR